MCSFIMCGLLCGDRSANYLQQTCFALSSMGNWKTEDEDGFNYLDFFNNIMELFRDDDG